MLTSRSPSTAPDASSQHPKQTSGAQLSNLTHYSTPTVAHLLTLLLHLLPSFLTSSTALLVVDSLATLVDTTYPRIPSRIDRRITDKRAGSFARPSDRRNAIVADIANALTRIAALKNVAILVTSHVVTQIRSVPLAALLRPALTTSEWENAMAARIVLFRDWGTADPSTSNDRKRGTQSARFARVMKAAGSRIATTRKDALVAFEIADEGVREMQGVRIARAGMHGHGHGDGDGDGDGGAVVSLKRGREAMEEGTENGEGDRDSDDEYGWTEEDMQVAAEGLVDERLLQAGNTGVREKGKGIERGSDARKGDKEGGEDV